MLALTFIPTTQKHLCMQNTADVGVEPSEGECEHFCVIKVKLMRVGTVEEFKARILCVGGVKASASSFVTGGVKASASTFAVEASVWEHFLLG